MNPLGVALQATLGTTLRAVLATLFLLPMAVLVVWSVAVRWAWPDLWPAGFTLRWWEMAVGHGTHGAVSLVWTSVGLAVAMTVCVLVLALPLAGLLARSERGLGNSCMELLVLCPLLVPPMAAVNGLQALMYRLGLLPSWWAVLAGHVIFGLPYGILILREGWRSVPKEQEEQARSLGAGPWVCLRTIVLPQLVPTLILAASLNFIISLGQYLPTLLLGGGQVRTLALALLPVVREGNRGPASALATLFLLTALAFCLFLIRFGTLKQIEPK